VRKYFPVLLPGTSRGGTSDGLDADPGTGATGVLTAGVVSWKSNVALHAAVLSKSLDSLLVGSAAVRIAQREERHVVNTALSRGIFSTQIARMPVPTRAGPVIDTFMQRSTVTIAYTPETYKPLEISA